MGIILILLMILGSEIGLRGAFGVRLGAYATVVASCVPPPGASDPLCSAARCWWCCAASANLRASFAGAAAAMFLLSGPFVQATYSP